MIKNKPNSFILFKEILKELRQQDRIPDDILDYMLPIPFNNQEFYDYRFDPGYLLYYGSNEGIYLRCFIEGIFDDTDEIKRTFIGTFKTLLVSDEAMSKMGMLAGYFTVALRKYVNDNIDNFTWKGFDVDFYKEPDKIYYGRSCANKERALKVAKERDERFPKITIRDNSTREITVIKDEFLINEKDSKE